MRQYFAGRLARAHTHTQCHTREWLRLDRAQALYSILFVFSYSLFLLLSISFVHLFLFIALDIPISNLSSLLTR